MHKSFGVIYRSVTEKKYFIKQAKRVTLGKISRS